MGSEEEFVSGDVAYIPRYYSLAIRNEFKTLEDSKIAVNEKLEQSRYSKRPQHQLQIQLGLTPASSA